MHSQFNNLSNAQMADEIGALDLAIKDREERLEAMKSEFKARNCSAARGDRFAVSVVESTSKRLDTKRLRADLGDALDSYELRVHLEANDHSRRHHCGGGSVMEKQMSARRAQARADKGEVVGGGYFVFRRWKRTGRIGIPNTLPFEHGSVESARTEAARLTKAHPGEVFEIFAVVRPAEVVALGVFVFAAGFAVMIAFANELLWSLPA